MSKDQGAQRVKSTQAGTGSKESREQEPRGGGSEQEGVVMAHGSGITGQPEQVSSRDSQALIKPMKNH